MMALLTDPQAWAALVTLSALEVVLGIDNVVFISILVTRLDPARRRQARQVGLLLALILRIALLFGLTRLAALSTPVVTVLGQSISWHDVVLIGGGLFLIGKATLEMHGEVEGQDEEPSSTGAAGAAFWLTIGQLILIDLVFSIDSIVTAIGMAQDIRIMILAVLIAIAIMYVASGSVSAFIVAHPTTKVLALAFLVLIGVALVADGFDFHVPRGYIYFAMAFAGAVEAINVLAQRRRAAKRNRNS
ncbi:MAG TPA: TerC family protein [Xanthobacteraceae bacterium]|nr:TerC family protein [Xanthobacteraceae bacterium]